VTIFRFAILTFLALPLFALAEDLPPPTDVSAEPPKAATDPASPVETAPLPAPEQIATDPIPPPAQPSIDPANNAEIPQQNNLSRLWFHDAGEYLASRSTRYLAPNDVSSKIISDAKRFDVVLGKRIPVFSWSEDSPSDGWAAGIDGAMLASLTRYSSQGRLTFATDTFDGMFGAWLGFVNGDGWLMMLRTAHLSAHLVDDSPILFSSIPYSQFWTEIIVGKSFPETRKVSDWNLHLQGSVGVNYMAIPYPQQPRANLSADFGYALSGPDSLAVIATADAQRAGVQGQKNSYLMFLGLGFLSRPQTTHRPFRFGVVHFSGSDYRNQLYQNTVDWTTFEIAAEF
jgi:hypothetical protein